MSVPIDAVCRTCLCQCSDWCGMGDRVSLEVSGETISPREMLHIFRDIHTQMLDNDKLPQKICLKCLTNLKIAFVFGKKSLQSQTTLNKIVNETNNTKTKLVCVTKNNNDHKITTNNNRLMLKTSDKTIVTYVNPIQRNVIDSKFVQIPNKKDVFFLKNNVVTKNINTPTVLKNVVNNNLKMKEKIQPKQTVFNVVSNNKSIVDNSKILITKPLIQTMTFKCSKCFQTYESKECFMKHLHTAHVEKMTLPLTKTCSVCDITFDTAEDLKEHNMIEHFSNLRPHKSKCKIACKICNVEFNNSNLLKLHLKKGHVNKTHVCKKCFGNYSTAHDLEEHDLKCKSIQNIICDICSDVGFVNLEEYVDHCKIDHRLYVCVYCLMTFHQDNLFESHVEVNHGGDKKRFCCFCCTLVFATSCLLLRHLNLKHGVGWNVVQCGICKDSNKIYGGSKSIRTHMQEEHSAGDLSNMPELKIITKVELSKTVNMLQVNSKTSGNIIEKGGGNQATVCRTCSKNFTTKLEYRKHVTTFHGFKSKKRGAASTGDPPGKNTVAKKTGVEGNVKKDSEGAYLCEICPKRFLRLVNLKKHFSRHMMSSLQCVRCGYKAENSAQMEEHLRDCRSAQVAEKLNCHICGKKLKTAAGLKYHIQAHVGIRKFACPSCSRRFLTCTSMKKHIRIVHSGVRPHLCNLCGRRFPSTDHLTKHVRHTHHNKRDHACKECNKKFLQVCHLTQHMWVHTGVKPFCCPYCPNAYSSACSLTKHLRRNHWEQQNQKHIEEEKFYQKLSENGEQHSVNETDVEVVNETDCNETKVTIVTDCNKVTTQTGEGGSTIIGILKYEKPQTYFYSPRKIVKYSKDSCEEYVDTAMPESVEIIETEECHIFNSSECESNVIYATETLQDHENEVEIRDSDEDVNETGEGVIEDDGESVNNISVENDIVIDGICGDELGEGIKVVIVSDEDIMVNGNAYDVQMMW